MDAAGFLPEGASAAWSMYWHTDDVDESIAEVRSLGGLVVTEPENTPYGRLAAVADSTGAQLKMHVSIL